MRDRLGAALMLAGVTVLGFVVRVLWRDRFDVLDGVRSAPPPGDS